jgi:hypothetical protein
VLTSPAHTHRPRNAACTNRQCFVQPAPSGVIASIDIFPAAAAAAWAARRSCTRDTSVSRGITAGLTVTVSVSFIGVTYSSD